MRPYFLRLQLAVLLLMLAPMRPAWADADPWVMGTNTWGAHGVYRADAARPLTVGSLTVLAAGEFFKGSSVFLPGDSFMYEASQLAGVLAPLAGFEVGLSAQYINSWYATVLTEYIETLGDPTLHLKYSCMLTPDVGLAVVGHLMVPTAVGSRGGPVANAFVGTLTAAATYAFSPYVEGTLNVGYVVDRTRYLTSNPLQLQRRYTLGIAETNRALWAMGAQAHVGDASGAVNILPFAEFSGTVNQGATWSTDVVLGTAGCKIVFPTSHLIEVDVGSDVRLHGAPQPGTAWAGVPAWRAFLQLSAHLSPRAWFQGAQWCVTDADCPEQQVCTNDMRCAVLEIREKTITQVTEVVRDRPTCRIAGSVVDAQTQLPVRDAVIHVDTDTTAISVNPKNGTFTSYALPTGTGLIKVRVDAPEHKHWEDVVRRGSAGEVVRLDIQMSPASGPTTGVLRGQIKDAKTGRPVNATLHVPSLGMKVSTDARGNFVLTLKIGAYDLLIVPAEKRYETQRKHIRLHEGETIILDVDMWPSPASGRE